MSKKSESLEETIAFVEQLKRRWMATVDAMVDPMMIINSEYKIIQTNHAMAKHSQKEITSLIDKPCFEIFAQRNSPCPHCKVKETFNDASNESFTLEQAIPDRYYEVSSQPIYDGEGKVSGALQVYRDRTMTKIMQNRLLQHEKLASIGLLAGGIAHELNNPLGGVLAFTQLLEKEMDSDSPLQEYVSEIHSAAKRCHSIVDNLLDFARQQPVSSKEGLDNVDIIPCLKKSLEFALVGHSYDHIKVVEEYQESPLLCRGNRNKLIQLFLNLIQNALQAMPREGILSIRAIEDTSQPPSTCLIEIRDSGLGISNDEIGQIFDPFYTSKPEGEGTGLGLAICHGIVEEHGGEIGVRSKIDEGSTFTIKFPIIPSSSPTKENS